MAVKAGNILEEYTRFSLYFTIFFSQILAKNVSATI